MLYSASSNVYNYHERACVHCGGCDSHLQSPSACVRISPVASYSPPSESASVGTEEEMSAELKHIYRGVCVHVCFKSAP